MVLGAIQRASALSFTELLVETGLPKATLVRLLHTLVESGWVRRQGTRGRYVSETSPGLASDKRAALTQLAQQARPVFARLQHAVPWPVNLGVREGTRMLIIDEPDSVVLGLAANYRQLGVRPPMLRSSMGLCHLAFCTEVERTDLLQQLSHSTDEPDQAVLRSGKLLQRLRDIRAQGYALRDVSVVPSDSPERYGAFSVPVMREGNVHACLSCSWLLQIASAEETVRRCLPPMLEAASALAVEVR
jgi:IclR family transcriptional regulator, mhp operon transcriptional activator